MCKECRGKDRNMVYAMDFMTHWFSVKMCSPLWCTVLTSELWQGILLYIFSDTGSNMHICKHVSEMSSSLNLTLVMVTDILMWRWLSASDGITCSYKFLNCVVPWERSLWLGPDASHSPKDSGGYTSIPHVPSWNLSLKILIVTQCWANCWILKTSCWQH